MACDLFEDILANKFDVHSVNAWLLETESQEVSDEIFTKYNSTRLEFVLYFLNHLRSQTSSILESVPNSSTPFKIKKLTNAVDNRKYTDKSQKHRVQLFSNKTNGSNRSNVSEGNNSFNTSGIYNTPKNISRIFEDYCNSSPKSSSVFGECTPKSSSVLEECIPKSNSLEEFTPKSNSLGEFTPKSNSLLGECPPKSNTFFGQCTPHNSSNVWNVNAPINSSNVWNVSTPKNNSSVWNVSTPKSQFCGESTPKNNSNSFRKLNTSTSKSNSRTELFNSANKNNSKTFSGNRTNSSEKSRHSNKSFGENNKSRDHCRKSLCLGDFITIDNRKSANKSIEQNTTNANQSNGKFRNSASKNRRINPTQLNKTETRDGFGNSLLGNESIVSNSNLPIEERDRLKDECIKIRSLHQSTSINTAITSPTLPRIESNPSEVTNSNILDIYVCLYGSILNTSFILSPIDELTFVLSLLVVRGVKKEDSSLSVDTFSSVHNCTYFAVNVLSNSASSLLALLDRMTIRLLSENVRIKRFNPPLSARLNKLYELRTVDAVGPVSSSIAANVCFESDTDSRENFPNDATFKAFRKQRDFFYDILRIWQDSRTVNDWDFSERLGMRVKNLVELYPDPVNYLHLARLVTRQLMRSAQDSSTSISTLDGLSANVSANKLSLLHGRLTTRSTQVSRGFVGHEVFYRDFLLHVGKMQFIVHIRDCLLAQLHDLHAQLSDENINEKASQFITSSRLLAKFIGFIEALPYRCEMEFPRSGNTKGIVLSSQIAARAWFQPSVNFKIYLSETEHLALIIPWIVEYMNQLDEVSIRLSCFNDILYRLFEIRSACVNQLASSEFYNISVRLVALSLGSLFSRPEFPAEFYYEWLDDKKITPNEITFDESLEIHERHLAAVCPELSELKEIVSGADRDGGRVPSRRHITPVSSVAAPSQSNQSKQLEEQLEEAFFALHPSSVKRTVDLVIDRVGHGCVRFVRKVLVPSVRTAALNTLRQKADQLITSSKLDELQLEIALRKEASTLANGESSEVCSRFWAEYRGMDRCSAASGALLGSEIPEEVIRMCTEIAARGAQHAVYSYLDKNCPATFVLSADYENEISKLLKGITNNSQPKRTVESELTISPTQLLMSIQSLIWKLLDRNLSNIADEEVTRILEDIADVLEKHSSIYSETVYKCLYYLCLDLISLLVTYHPETLIAEHNMQCLVRICSSSRDNCDSVRLISARNVLLMNQSLQPSVSWSTLATILLRFISEKCLTADRLTEQCTALFQTSWPNHILSHLSVCLKKIAEGFKITAPQSDEDKFSLFLDFLSETSRELDF